MPAFHRLLRPAEHRPRRSSALTTTTITILLPTAAIATYAARAPHLGIIGRQLAGTESPPPPGAVAALWWHLALALPCGAAALLGTTAAIWVAWTPRAQTFTRFARFSALLTVLAAAAADIATLFALHDPADAPALLLCASTAAVLECCALLPAALGACYGITVTLRRCLANTDRRLATLHIDAEDGQAAAPLQENDFPLPGGSEPTAQDRWQRGYQVPGAEPGGTGFCLSGGGIRSASVSLGFLQTMRGRLLQARYLVSVSGGGFTAGALQQALTEAIEDPPAGEVLRDPEHAYAHGGPEEDHVRRHASYLANSTTETLTAFGVLARGLLLSLFALFAPAVILGVAAGWLYRIVPVTEVTAAPAHLPTIRTGALLALALLILGALGVSLFARGTASRNRSLRLVLRRTATRLALLAALVATVTIAIPVLIWLAYRLPTTDPGLRIGSPLVAVLLTYAATLASILWRRCAALGSTTGVRAAVPGSLLQRILVIVTTALLALAWLLLFVVAAGTGGTPAALWTGLGFAVVLLVVGGILDETSLSLHPFYRERVACTFAVRRVRRDGTDIAVPYPSTERTTLSRYGRTDARFPQVIFAATANLTGEGRTPPGLNAVSYTLSADWVGGPDIGWVRTGKLEHLVPPRFRRDLTVQGAVAVSGAAFASAMGRAARWFQVLFAVSGARLGAWLPNPDFVLAAPGPHRPDRWSYPGLPHARRLPYLWREVFGIHSHRDRLLHVTDGGHYDNLGLVELLRRRCGLIYCVDAGVDAPPTAATLADALTLAEQELGIRVELHDPWHAEPGSGKPLDTPEPLGVLNPRLVHSPIITGTIHYPPESGLPPAQRTGHLVVAKALLWRDLPYPLLSYAAHHPEFPHDSTGDQFFDDGKFTAYTELGRRLGELVNHHMPTGVALNLPRTGRRPGTTARRSPTRRP